MEKIMARPMSYLSAFAACTIMSLATGCASGGFKLTRSYAGWVNSQQVILRVVLYILTSFVFVVTLLIDAVIYNTMDFWQGRVSAGDYHFKSGEKTYFVRHEVLPNQLKRSTIQILNAQNTKEHEVILNETNSKEIEVYVDGTLRSRVHNISELPIASIYDSHGDLQSEKMIFSATSTAQSAPQSLIR